MEWIFVAIILLIIFSGAVLKKKGAKSDDHCYRKRDALFTVAESKFLVSLDEAVSDKYRIFGKVRVADVIAPEKGLNRSDWQVAFNKISAKHFDYVLCSKDDLVVVAAIELDDSSHLSKKAISRDAFLENACASAKLQLIRFPVKSSYDARIISDQIESQLGSVD